MKFLLSWYFHVSHWPNGLCHLGDDTCEEVAREVNYNVFVISSNTRCTGTQCLQLHGIFPLPLKQEGILNDGRPCCIWCICGHSCAGSHCQYQLIIVCCNLFSCNGSVVLCVLTHQHYCGNHDHRDHQVALALRRILWHNNVDCCIECHVGHLHLCDKDDTNQR